MDLDRLRTFHVVCETLHFGRAAERLLITRSAVSQQIAALEKDLGAALFERIGRRVFLTPAGEALAAEVNRILPSLARAREAVAAVADGSAGRLRVGASTTVGIYVMCDVLGRFRSDFPHVELDFRISNSSRIEALVRANELDLAVCGGSPGHEELFEIDLGPDRIAAVASPSLLRGATRLSASDLPRWPYLAREQGSATRATVERALAASGVRLTPALELPSPEALVRAARAGLGFAFVSERAAREWLEAGALGELPLQDVEFRRTLVAAHHRDKRFTPPMRHLVELLKERLAPERWPRDERYGSSYS